MKFIAMMTNIRTALTRIPYGDQAFFIKRDVFDALKGFRNMPLLEDMEIMKRLKKEGYSTKLIKDCVMTSARRWETRGYIKTTIQNRVITLLYMLGISPEFLYEWYYRNEF